MRADNTAHLARSTRFRTEQARDRAVDAIRRLDHDGHDVSIAAVSRAAGVSRSFLYRHHELRAEIDRLRQTRPTANRRLPSKLRASEDSQQARAEALRAEIERLTAENRWLRQQAETLLGERRAAPREQPARP
jgi:chromosome segregation ATPase